MSPSKSDTLSSVPCISKIGIGLNGLQDSRVSFIITPAIGATALNKSEEVHAKRKLISPPLDIPVAKVFSELVR